MVTASISLRDVGRTFGATRALAGVDLDLKPGVTGLLGPNGAGKTTLLRLLATALPPSQGQVRVLGLDPEVPAERTGIRRQLGYQPQEVGFPRGFTAFAFVDYIALLKEQSQPAARHAEVRRVLDLVGLSDLGAKRIRAMSGGQRRRVSLAQALLGSPPVLILDEPTTGVDPEQRVMLRTVLAEIARTSVVVLSTHQTEDVAALCERVIVLDRGRVRYDGPVTDLTGQAAGRVWLADEPDPAASVSWRTGTGRYRNVGARVRDGVEHAEPSLEDAYLLLRGGTTGARVRRGGGVMTATLTFGPPATSPGRATLHRARRPGDAPVRPQPGLPVRRGDHRVFARGPARRSAVTEIDDVNAYPAIFLGGFGMMAAYWLTRSMRASEPVAGVTPVTRPARTAALCAVAIVPFACGCLALLGFLQLNPVGSAIYGPFSPSARIAVLVGQIVVPALGGPLLGVALGRWVRFPGAAFVLFLLLYGWVSLVTILTMSRPDSAPVAVLRLFSPFAFFTLHSDAGGVTAWRGSPWFFIGWQLALCAIAVLVALLRGAEGRVRTRIIRALGDRGRGGRDLARAGRPRRVHPRRHRVMTGAVLRAGAWPAVAGVSGVAVVVGGCGAAFPAAATMLLPICFALLAAAAAFTLDEPASLVVDVTPTGPVRRTQIRAVALLAPLAAGALVLLAAALRGQALPWAAASLALAGNILLGFAVACVARTRTGEPGPVAGTAVVLVLMAPASCRTSRAGSAHSRRPAPAACPRTPCGGPSSRCARWPSPSRSVAEPVGGEPRSTPHQPGSR